jgi:hypothetical protein
MDVTDILTRVVKHPLVLTLLRTAPKVGHIADIRADGFLRIIWKSRRREWVPDSPVRLAPSDEPQKRQR